MKIKVGVIGAGIYGKVLINAFYGAHKHGQIDLAAVADLDPQALSYVRDRYGVRGYADYREMFREEGLDAVAIVTPDYLHEQAVIDAARSGVHILAQKPLSTDANAGRRMINACRDAGVMLYVDFHKRFDPGHIQMKQAIDSGKLGEIEYGYVCMEDKILVPSQWFKSWAHNSSPAWFIGIHFYDLICWLLGENPVRVYATGVKKKLLGMGIDTYDSLQAKFEFPGGASITVDASWILPNSFSSIVNQQIRLVGTEGFQEVDSQDRGVVAAYASDDFSHVINPYGQLQVNDPVAGPIPVGYTIESMLHFLRLADRIKNGGATLEDLEAQYPTGEQAQISTIMCQAAHESAHTGAIISIRYV